MRFIQPNESPEPTTVGAVPAFGPMGRDSLAQPNGLGLRASPRCGRKGCDQSWIDHYRAPLGCRRVVGQSSPGRWPGLRDDAPLALAEWGSRTGGIGLAIGGGRVRWVDRTVRGLPIRDTADYQSALRRDAVSSAIAGRAANNSGFGGISPAPAFYRCHCGSGTPPGCPPFRCIFRGCRGARPPATLCQPGGLATHRHPEVWQNAPSAGVANGSLP
jgi:hypothetical protein